MLGVLVETCCVRQTLGPQLAGIINLLLVALICRGLHLLTEGEAQTGIRPLGLTVYILIYTWW